MPLTQDQALDLLISFAPTWHHSLERRLAYDPESHTITYRYDLFTSQANLESYTLFQGQDLQELVDSAKNWIYIQRIEQTLTCP